MSQVTKKFTLERYQAIHTVPEEFDGKRLDQFLMTILLSFSREKIKQKIVDGDITILGRQHKHRPSTKIYYKERVEILTHRSNLEDEFWNGEKIVLEETPKVILETDQIIAINKPPFMSAHPAGKHLFNCVTVFFESKFGHTIHSIHRLDRETSGVMLVGKTPKSAQLFTEIFDKDQIKKCYVLISKKEKQDIPAEFIAEERLGTKPDTIPNLYTYCYPKESTEGKHAKTGFKRIYENDHYLISLAFLYTGRQHQIRAHAAHHGFPLVGDKLYNGDKMIFGRFKDFIPTKQDHELMEIPRQALHALCLKFRDPKNQEIVTLVADFPEDLKEWMRSKIDQTPEEILKKIEIELKNWQSGL